MQLLWSDSEDDQALRLAGEVTEKIKKLEKQISKVEEL